MNKGGGFSLELDEEEARLRR